ncbi:MAG: hypothetical protein JXA92_14210 [candidate division Zixibacteria bacterium]|nr:hypothetical protein [candidate division Zixibacteria bacterium]
MKKIALAVVLLLLVVGVSYLQVHRQENREEALYKNGYEKGSETAEELADAVDSLKQVVDSQEVNFSNQLEDNKQVYTGTIDSLKNMVSSRDEKIMALESKTSAPPKQNTTTSKTSDKHAQILSYYKKRFNQLPNDLTAYEKRVAVSEIREETAQKFSISTEELNQIRKKNNLTY